MEVYSKATESLRKSTLVHYILSHSYVLFFVAIIGGMITDHFVPTSIISENYADFGFLMMLLGSVIIYWAQSTSGATSKQLKDTGVRVFDSGPYKFSRNPTHIGLGVMTLGFGLIMQSVFIILFLVIVYTISKLVFLPAEEKILCDKYGDAYIEYKNKVTSRI